MAGSSVTTHSRAPAQPARASDPWGATGRAMDEFYAEDVSMQENTESPTLGRAANLEREEAFMSNVAEWERCEVVAAAAKDDRTFSETVIEFIKKHGAHVTMAQVTRALWSEGRIVDERFYHG